MNPLKNKRKTLENAVFKAFSRVFALVGATGFEPAAPWSQTKCATKLRHAPTTVIILLDILHKVNPYF